MTKTDIIRRLSSYWKLELGNAVLLPVIFICAAYAKGESISWISIFCMIPMVTLLFVGGIYWRLKWVQLRDGRSANTDFFGLNVMSFIDRVQAPVFWLSLIAVIVTVMAWIVPATTAGLADQIIATVATVLAVLEYINYYHRQLQHFDHTQDFKKLLSGRGFKRAQMAVDLAQWRAAKGQV